MTCAKCSQKHTQPLFDPDSSGSFPSPVKCPCGQSWFTIAQLWKEVYAAKKGKIVERICPHCCSCQTLKLKTAYGDPRNLAWILHWDGFRAHSGENKSSGVIDITVANMSKAQRTKSVHTFLICFVPVSAVKSGIQIQWLAPFLEPFIKEIEKGFVEGEYIFLPGQILA